ncbi:MAG: sigma-70 family RNA polymerase sigma factor [Bacteroidales bacterium]|jgi:RNA polymerase sigma-70 factor (ECF subfamily)
MKDERTIIKAILEGHVQQYGLLVERYQNPVFRVIFNMVNNYEDARELTQDVFVKAYEALSQYNPEYKFFSWIYRIAINRALLFVRNKKPYVPLEKITLHKETDPGPETEYDLKTRDDLVGKAVGALKETYKTVVLLKYYAGLSYTEIADTLEIPEKTVKSRLFDARMMLKDKLEKTLKYVD